MEAVENHSDLSRITEIIIPIAVSVLVWLGSWPSAMAIEVSRASLISHSVELPDKVLVPSSFKG